MQIQDNLYGSKTQKEQEFWQKMIEQKHKEIEIIIESNKNNSNTIKKENLYTNIKKISNKEKETLCNNTLSKLFNNPEIKRLVDTIAEKNPKINKKQASKMAISLLTKLNLSTQAPGFRHGDSALFV